MREINDRNFGYLIAYIIPGFLALWGLSLVSPEIGGWLRGAQESGPTLGGFLYITVGSLGIGMLASLFRWATIDQLLERTGLPRPHWDDRLLPERLEAFEALVENHFRYYQFYANTLVASLVPYGIWRSRTVASLASDAGYLLLVAVLVAGARNALGHYYRRGDLLMSSPQTQEHSIMTNGHSHTTTESRDSNTKPKTKTKTEPAAKPQAQAASDKRKPSRSSNS